MMSVKLLYSAEKTNSFRPVPWHYSLAPFPAYRGAGARYDAFLAVAQEYVPAFAGAVPSDDGYACPRVSFDTAPGRLIKTSEKQTLLLVPCAAEADEQTMLLTLRGGFRGRYGRVGAVGAEILLDRNSEPRNIHCCPTRHLIVRLTHPNGYVFAETGHRCGTGIVEIFSWGGYQTLTTEEFGAWQMSQAPDMTEESRATARADAEAARLTAVAMRQAAADAAADAKAASRNARASFLPRLVALQARLATLRVNNPNVAYGALELGETYFVLGWGGDKLYTEEDVAQAERSVAYWEQQAAKRKQRAAMIPAFKAFALRIGALGLSLNFGEESVNWPGGYYGGFTYDDAGLAAFEADLVRKEEELAQKRRDEAAAAAKVEAEAEAAARGLPGDIHIWRRMGGINNRGNGWVIRPDGTRREADRNPSEGDLVWNQILPGELVLCYRQASRHDIAHCEVVHRPAEVTAVQLAVAKQLEEDMGAVENAFGLDEQLTVLLDRRKAAIEEAMTGLPEALRPPAWDYQVLASPNGMRLKASARGWINYAPPFDTSCEGCVAQIVFSCPAADGRLQVVVFKKWGGDNLNLLWLEGATVTEVTPAPLVDEPVAEEPVVEEPPDMATALQRLRERYPTK